MTTEVLLKIDVQVAVVVLCALEVSFAVSHVSISEIWGRGEVVFVFVKGNQGAFVAQSGGRFVQSVVDFRLAYLTQSWSAPPKTVWCGKRTLVVKELVLGLADEALVCVQVVFDAVVCVSRGSQHAEIVHLV